ncbi:hypothetical protein Csa_023601, partial [Cucumis sativus]
HATSNHCKLRQPFSSVVAATATSTSTNLRGSSCESVRLCKS